MPIRPEMRKLYPPPREWRAIRARILARAAHRCEWCGKPNGETVGVDKEGYWYDEIAHGWRDARGRTMPSTGQIRTVRVVLTIAHLDHNPANNDEEHNLRALCQRCHLAYDAREHARNAARTRAKRAAS